MIQEELKEKIAGILKEAMKPIEYGGDIEHAPEVHYPTEDEIAHALIEAGIGDVLGHRVFVSKDGKEIKQLYNGKEVEQIVKERNMYKHRAEVAEKALKNAVDDYVGLECTCKGVYDSHFDKDEECEGCEWRRFEMEDAIPCAVNKYLNYAEKELAEEEEK